MRRVQAFEFCDQPWIPALFREGFMDCLNNIHRLFEPYRHIAPIIQDWARRLGATRILDLGSGGGEQIATLLKYLPAKDAPAFVLSDLYPQLEAYRALQQRFGAARIDYLAVPAPIAVLPAEHRVLTIFSAFHHLTPPVAQALLAEVVRNRDGLCIVEFTRRTALDLVSMFPAFFLNMLAPLTAERLRPGKLLWGTLIPVIPVMVSYDGFISAMRSYTNKELIELLPPGAAEHFLIEYGEVPWGRLPLSKASYFMLSRKSRLQSAAARDLKAHSAGLPPSSPNPDSGDRHRPRS